MRSCPAGETRARARSSHRLRAEMEYLVARVCATRLNRPARDRQFLLSLSSLLLRTLLSFSSLFRWLYRASFSYLVTSITDKQSFDSKDRAKEIRNTNLLMESLSHCRRYRSSLRRKYFFHKSVILDNSYEYK